MNLGQLFCCNSAIIVQGNGSHLRRLVPPRTLGSKARQGDRHHEGTGELLQAVHKPQIGSLATLCHSSM